MSESLQLVLTALGNAILNSIWQTGLVWLLVTATTRYFKNIPPAHVSRLSFVALLASFFTFISTFILTLRQPEASLGMLRWFGGIPYLYNAMMYAAVLYMLLLFVPVIKFIAGIRAIYRLKSSGLGKVPGRLKIFLLDACQHLGIRRKVKIFTSGIISSPITFGFFKPVILLPVAIVNQISLHQAEAIILHELAHIKRNDYLQNIITQIIITVLYFNPFAKMLAKLQDLEREKSADGWVMQFEYCNYVYAQTLLQMARLNLGQQSTLAIPISGTHTPLLERIEVLMGKGRRRFPSAKILASMITLIVAVFALSVLSKKNTLPATAHLSRPVLPLAYYQPVVLREAINKPSVTAIESVTPESPVAAPAPKTPVKETIPAGDITGVVEQQPVARASFASNTTIVTPALPEAEEENVQSALNATKKIVTELSWKALDHALAETVTKEDKQALKELYSKTLAAANWQKQADLLRLNYDNINWEKASDKLTSAVESIRLDSLYNKYAEVTAALKSYQQLLRTDVGGQKPTLTTLDELIKKYSAAVHKIDSLRNRKVVEL